MAGRSEARESEAPENRRDHKDEVTSDRQVDMRTLVQQGRPRARPEEGRHASNTATNKNGKTDHYFLMKSLNKSTLDDPQTGILK